MSYIGVNYPKRVINWKNQPMGYIYLIRQRGSNKFKIGITSNVEARRSAIERDLRKPCRVVIARKVWNKGKFERFLHTFFKDRNFHHRGSGKTEWFRFSLFSWFQPYLLILVFDLFQEALKIAGGIFLIYVLIRAFA